tara:strand:+ start:11331 stop:12281 length:951 start_codon:yes stop_codon:yes gene_type:complete
VKIYNSVEKFNPDFKVVLTLGTFDGVHIGHQSIINKLNEYTEKNGGESVLLTFYPHPRHVLFPEDQKLKLLSTIKERCKMLEGYGLKHFIIQEFTSNFSRIKSVNFVRDILVNQLKVHKLIIGYDHHFGRNREGNFEELSKLSDLYSYKIEKVEPQKYRDISVSSTKIRSLITESNFPEARKYLGRHFSFCGKVVSGEGNGKNLGFPTANLVVENKWKLIPENGVYAVIVSYKSETFIGMMNIGYNPTFNSNIKSIEVHVLDFKEDIYGQELEVSVVQKIRDEKKFSSVEDLRKVLEIDENKVRLIFKNNDFIKKG